MMVVVNIQGHWSEIDGDQTYDHRLLPTRPRQFEHRGPYEISQMKDVTQYFIDMTLTGPGSDDVVRIPERSLPLPTNASFTEWNRLARHYGRAPEGWKYVARQHFDQHGYPTDM